MLNFVLAVSLEMNNTNELCNLDMSLHALIPNLMFANIV